MKASQGSRPAAKRLVALALVSCTLANRFCTAWVAGVAGRASIAIGAGSRWRRATTCELARGGGEDTVSEDAVLTRFKKLQVRVWSEILFVEAVEHRSSILLWLSTKQHVPAEQYDMIHRLSRYLCSLPNCCCCPECAQDAEGLWVLSSHLPSNYLFIRFNHDVHPSGV